MDQKKALRECRNIWGRSAGVRYNKNASLRNTDKYRRAQYWYDRAEDLARRLGKVVGEPADAVFVVAYNQNEMVNVYLDRLCVEDTPEVRNGILMSAQWLRVNVRRSLIHTLDSMVEYRDKAIDIDPSFAYTEPNRPYRCEVGTVMKARGDSFFMTFGGGDTWEQAIEDANERYVVITPQSKQAEQSNGK